MLDSLVAFFTSTETQGEDNRGKRESNGRHFFRRQFDLISSTSSLHIPLPRVVSFPLLFSESCRSCGLGWTSPSPCLWVHVSVGSDFRRARDRSTRALPTLRSMKSAFGPHDCRKHPIEISGTQGIAGNVISVNGLNKKG